VTLLEHLKSILHANASTSHVHSVFVDESIDQNHEQHLIVYCCHLGPQGRGFQMTFFFGVIKDTRRKSMLNALFSCLEKLCLN
jgi:hypothetical protein